MITIYTDGSSLKNGTENNMGGYGYIILDERNKNIYCGYGNAVNTTNQKMELLAPIKALEFLLLKDPNACRDEIQIYSDSAYFINCMNQAWYAAWERNGWLTSKKEPVKNVPLWKKLIEYTRTLFLDFNKVKGHNGDIGNEIANVLAQYASTVDFDTQLDKVNDTEELDFLCRELPEKDYKAFLKRAQKESVAKIPCKILTFSGKAESGKDTTAQILKELLENNDKKVCIIHYADFLKYIAKQYYNWNGEKDEFGRGLLQRIGTDIVRKKNPTFWVDIVKQFINAFWNEFDYFFIPDARFPNEIMAFGQDELAKYSKAVYISRPNHENKLTPAQRQHISETALDEYIDKMDIKVDNTGDLDTLKLMVMTMLDEI